MSGRVVATLGIARFEASDTRGWRSTGPRVIVGRLWKTRYYVSSSAVVRWVLALVLHSQCNEHLSRHKHSVAQKSISIPLPIHSVQSTIYMPPTMRNCTSRQKFSKAQINSPSQMHFDSIPNPLHAIHLLHVSSYTQPRWYLCSCSSCRL